MSFIFWAIILMAVVTYIPRVMPVLLLSRRNLPEPLTRWLSYVPVAVLSAILGPALLLPAGSPEFDPAQNPGLWVTLPVFVVAAVTRSLFITVLSGMAGVAIMRFFL